MAKLKLSDDPRWVFHPAASPAAFGLAFYGHEPAVHHWQWLDIFLDSSIQRSVIVAPRESAKTTWGLIYMVWYIGNNPLSSNFIGSVSDKQAQERLSMVKTMIESDERWKKAFPHVVPDLERGWSNNGLFVKRADIPYAEWIELVAMKGHMVDPTLVAGGAGSRVVIGKRISGIVLLDDLMDDKNSLTPLQRDRVYKWLMLTVAPTLLPDAKIVLIGTRWHRDDIIGRLLVRSDWHINSVSAIDEDGNSYWPEVWPMERLMAKKHEIGQAFFGAAYLNKPEGLAGQDFDLSWFKYLPSPLPKMVRVVLGIDLAISLKEHADYTVIATLGFDADNNFYILGITRGHWQMDRTMDEAQKHYDVAKARWGRCDLVAIEQVAYQAAIVQTMLRTTRLPILGVVPDKDKRTRAYPWKLRFEQEMGYADRESSWWATFADEAVDFPLGEHDDMIDAISAGWMGVNSMGPLIMV